MRLKSIYLALLLCLSVRSGMAATECPKQVAIFQNNGIYAAVEQQLREVYSQLGCELKLVYLPPKRALLHFNNHHIDGEALRSQAIEDQYLRKFVKSEELFKVTFGLWGRDGEPRSVGYINGMIGTKPFVEKFERNGIYVHGFDTNEKLFSSLKRGVVDAIIIGSLAWFTYFDEKPKIEGMGLLEVYSKLQMFHYTGKEYTPFMDRFNAHIRESNPFEAFN